MKDVELRERFDKIDEFQEETREKFKQIDEFQEETREKFKQTDKSLLELKEELLDFEKFTVNKLNEHDILLKEIHKSVLLTESYIRDKIPTLFDASTLNQEQHENFNNKFNCMESSINNNSLKISVLEDTTNLHSKQLKKLTS